MPLSALGALLALGEALAGTALWLSDPLDPAVDAALEHRPAATLLTDSTWSAADQRAIDRLADELEAVTPLLAVFDGELQIMLRLETALSDVRAIRAQDRDLVYRALLFQGTAVDRYFQDELGSEDEAAPYRATVAERVEVRPWADAVALDPDRAATAAEIPEEPQRLRFQEVRARVLLARPAQVLVQDLPPAGRLVVDGLVAPTPRRMVLPGRHWLALEEGTYGRGRWDERLESGLTRTLRPEVTPSDLGALEARLRQGERVVTISPALARALAAQQAPVAVLVRDGRRLLRYDLKGSTLVLHNLQSPAPVPPVVTAALRTTVGGGWLYDGDFYLQNAAAGAPSSYGTVNAFSPVVSLAGELRVGLGSVGAGVDGLAPLGDWHDLPVGEDTMRLRLHPYLLGGVPWVQATAGFLFPWHVGLGARGHVPLVPELGLELTGAYVYGLGLTREREAGQPAFEPGQVQSAWVGVSFQR